MREWLKGLLGRSGLFPHLSPAWKAEERARRDKLRKEVARQIRDATRPLWESVREHRAEIKLLRAVLAANSTLPFERHRGSADHGAVATHAARAIAAAPLIPSPTPHLVVENLLPDATYRALLDAIPPDECFSDRDSVKQNFRPAQAKVVPEFSAAMWRFIEEDVIPKVLVPALMARLQPFIAETYGQRYGERAPSVSALSHEATAGRLMLRRPGYHLEPHLDPSRVIVTCLIYLARPGDDVSFGTQFFSVNEAPRIDQAKTFYPREAGYVCELAKTVAFTPNTAVAFLNAGAAAHGATIPDSAPKDTKRYAYQFYISPEASGLAAATGEMVDERQG